MKKFFLLLTLVSACLMARAQYEIPFTEIPYNVKYHWGLIDVMIARGNVKVQSDGTRFHGTLDGTSIPWEGNIICVSDTLTADMRADGSLGENVLYQSGWYRRPHVSQFRSNTYDPADPAIYKNIAGQGEYSASGDSMEAITITSDILGMFYWARVLNFEAFEPGQQISIPISGPYSRGVTITYKGKGIYNNDGNTYPTYDCAVEYAYGGGPSGYQVECKFAASDRVPLQRSASLPLGEVEMLYAP